MGESYFGKAAVGNSELVKRLRAKRRVWPDTAARIRAFMRSREISATPSKPVADVAPQQGAQI
jgi:hypothetical protein